MLDMKELIKETQQLIGKSLTPYQIHLLDRYVQELDIWNERYSLTAIHDQEKVRVKHFLDSFSCYLVMENTPMRRLIDIGSGAGFPGIPLKILLPEVEVTLVDSVKKKTEFCQHIIEVLQLEGIEVVRERAERLAKDPQYREQYDWAVARAVANLRELAEYLIPFIRLRGHMLAMKGDSGPAEAHDAMEAIKLLGGELSKIHQLTLPGVAENRYLVVIKKKASTPERYPRRVGIPQKRPL
jgi:16S rRNA (guanine527-N7)-methyltransferase